MLTVRGLRKAFAATSRRDFLTVAVDGADIDVSAGTFASVLGPSGSGKTTLLRCIAGFERPDAGVITVNGKDVASPTTFVPPYARGIGVVPQEGALFPNLTVADNIAFGLAGRRRNRRARVMELLELVGLTGLGARRPGQLSGGQQQRVALARALAPGPDLVLLDEPFSALDAQLRVELREEVRELLRRLGSTILLVTHDQGEALSLSDHLVVMREGKVIAAGPPRAVYDNPVDVELGQFLGDALIVPGDAARTLDGVQVTCALGRLQVSRWHGGEGRCRVLIRPEQVAVLRPGARPAPDPSADVAAGTVISQSYFGHDALLRVGVPGVVEPIAVRLSGRHNYRAGDAVIVRVTQPVCTYLPS